MEELGARNHVEFLWEGGSCRGVDMAMLMSDGAVQVSPACGNTVTEFLMLCEAMRELSRQCDEAMAQAQEVERLKKELAELRRRADSGDILKS